MTRPPCIIAALSSTISARSSPTRRSQGVLAQDGADVADGPLSSTRRICRTDGSARNQNRWVFLCHRQTPFAARRDLQCALELLRWLVSRWPGMDVTFGPVRGLIPRLRGAGVRPGFLETVKMVTFCWRRSAILMCFKVKCSSRLLLDQSA